MIKRVLVTGKNGQLGQSLQKVVSQNHCKQSHRHCERSEAISLSQYEFTFVGRNELDLANPKSITDFFTDKQFDVIINCAAYTAVDKAESEPELADQINHHAVKQLAEIAKANDSTLIHISTDYVFDGQNHRPYIETDPVAPQGIYGATKLKGEQACLNINPRGVIIRTSWLYSEFGNNFVKTMLRLDAERDSLNVIFDQVGSPTYATDLAEAILTVIASNSSAIANSHSVIASKAKQSPNMAIYHYSSEGVCSWYDFAKAIFELSKLNCQVNPIETQDYPTPAKRPHYSLMNKAKIKADFDLSIPYWRDALTTCLNELNEQ